MFNRSRFYPKRKTRKTHHSLCIDYVGILFVAAQNHFVNTYLSGFVWNNVLLKESLGVVSDWLFFVEGKLFVCICRSCLLLLDVSGSGVFKRYFCLCFSSFKMLLKCVLLEKKKKCIWHIVRCRGRSTLIQVRVFGI